jgi:type II restriction-modification system restriction subunit
MGDVRAHYLFTNDMRDSVLDSKAQEFACMFLNNTVPSANDNKSLNNSANTIGFYLNLINKGNVALVAANGDIRSVVLNFIKTFQYPNPRTKDSFIATVRDGIQLAPMREIIKILFLYNQIFPDKAYLTIDEIRHFVFFNEKIAFCKTPNRVEVINDIETYRASNELPSCIVPEDERDWNYESRQLSCFLGIMAWSGFIDIDKDGLVKLVIPRQDDLQYKAALLEVIMFNEYWEYGEIDINYISTEAFNALRTSYFNYCDQFILRNDKLNAIATSDIPSTPRQRIFFGAPGTGKSYSLNEEAKSLVSNKSNHIERVTFHPDYTYANFVGSYKPIMKQSDIACLDDDSKKVLSVLNNRTITTQEKYDALYESFKSTDGLTRLPIILGLYFDDSFETKKEDGTKASNNNSVERNHGRAIRKYVQLLSEESYKEKIAYEYVPGPFIRLLVKALQNPEAPYVLIVEEINRANVAAVFGDVFQLLDRNNDGESEYSITTTADMRAYLQRELGKDKDVTTIKIPSNLFIWATMNSADQGVYPMDTAFKRRWTFSYYGLDDEENNLSAAAIKPRFELGKSNKLISWNSLRKAINDELSTDTYNINEDKLMGPFFLKEEALKDNTSFNEAFKNKVLMYLFDDVVKQKRRSFFNCENSNRYSSICNAFDREGIKIFPDGVVNSKWLQEDESTISEDGEPRVTEV